MKRKLVIDTDPGIDDALALMMACKSPLFDVMAVTTVCGNTTVENTTRNARFVLDFTGCNRIPIHSGARKPLSGKLIQAVIHGKNGFAGINSANPAKLNGDAVVKLLSLIKSNPYQITVVALGPLTNIAQAIKNDPGTMKLVKEIVMMGGAIAVPGNKSSVAEFNMLVDPEAAACVLEFPVPKTMIPLDACNEVTLELSDIEKIQDKRLRQMLQRMLRPYTENLAKDAGINGAVMYDPLVIFYLMNPGACVTWNLDVKIEVNGNLTRGMTVADPCTVANGTRPNVTVVMKTDRHVFAREFITTLNEAYTENYTVA